MNKKSLIKARNYIILDIYNCLKKVHIYRGGTI